MEINTKYNLEDVVWGVKQERNKIWYPIRLEIDCIDIHIHFFEDVLRIEYNGFYSEDDLFNCEFDAVSACNARNIR